MDRRLAVLTCALLLGALASALTALRDAGFRSGSATSVPVGSDGGRFKHPDAAH